MGRNTAAQQTTAAGNVPAVHVSQSAGFDDGALSAEQRAWLDLLRHQLAADERRAARRKAMLA
jgi:hypothetical protein